MLGNSTVFQKFITMEKIMSINAREFCNAKKYRDYIVQDKLNLYRTITIRQDYLKSIREGRKIVEGQIYKGIFTNLRQGNQIIFIANNDPYNFVRCKVISTKRYNNFKEMLQAEGFQNCLPHAPSLQKASDIFNSMFGYREQVAIYGAIAIRIEVID